MDHIKFEVREGHPKGAISVIDEDGVTIAIIKGFDLELEERFKERHTPDKTDHIRPTYLDVFHPPTKHHRDDD